MHEQCLGIATDITTLLDLHVPHLTIYLPRLGHDISRTRQLRSSMQLHRVPALQPAIRENVPAIHGPLYILRRGLSPR